MNRKLILSATLCALLSFPLHSKMHPAVAQRLADCGKTYAKQFQSALELELGRELSKDEEKLLSEKYILYAIDGRRSISFDDLNGDGEQDYLSFESKSFVDYCGVTDKPFSKNNNLYIELSDGTVLNESWIGDMISEVRVYRKPGIAIAKQLDKDGNVTFKSFKYR